jgi:hypothetical protein
MKPTGTRAISHTARATGTGPVSRRQARAGATARDCPPISAVPTSQSSRTEPGGQDDHPRVPDGPRRQRCVSGEARLDRSGRAVAAVRRDSGAPAAARSNTRAAAAARSNTRAAAAARSNTRARLRPEATRSRPARSRRMKPAKRPAHHPSLSSASTAALSAVPMILPGLWVCVHWGYSTTKRTPMTYASGAYFAEAANLQTGTAGTAPERRDRAGIAGPLCTLAFPASLRQSETRNMISVSCCLTSLVRAV